MQWTMKRALTTTACLLVWLAAAMPLPAQDQPEGVTKVATVEGITEYQLDNGLRFLLFPDQSKQQVTVNITYLVGSRHEGYGETGMAHLLEHLAFKGTPNHPDIPAELTEHGAFPNGTTWFDRTNYFETFRPPTRTWTGRSIWRRTGWSTPSSPPRTSNPR